MSELFESGRIVDLLLVFMSVEGGVLWLYRRRTGRGVPTPTLFAGLAAGACLLLALRAALAESGWGPIGLWLALALVAHLADLRGRWC